MQVCVSIPTHLQSLEVVVLPLWCSCAAFVCSWATGSHDPSETHIIPAKETIPKAPYQAFIPCGFLTILLAQMMSSVMLLDSRSSGREAQPRELTEGRTPARSRFPHRVQGGPGTRAAPGIGGRLGAAHSPHCQAAISPPCLNAARQASSSASAWPARTINTCFLLQMLVCLPL